MDKKNAFWAVLAILVVLVVVIALSIHEGNFSGKFKKSFVTYVIVL